MILTVTPNPSIDRTVILGTPLRPGGVHRIAGSSVEPGGKGVNVARALTLAGVDARALLPAPADDPLVSALGRAGVAFSCVPSAGPVRTNLAITEAGGITTKINEPGADLDGPAAAALAEAVRDQAAAASWVVLSGSLPPGLPPSWYADVATDLAPLPCRVAVDTSDRPLAELVAHLGTAVPDLLKPNAEELAGMVGGDADRLEAAAAAGDPGPVLAAASTVLDRGAGALLVTLGAAGAVLVDRTGAWLATPPPITARSTVGAGDSALAGYLRAEIAGSSAPQRLALAVAYGSAAAALPGSALPGPDQIDLKSVAVTTLSSTRPTTRT